MDPLLLHEPAHEGEVRLAILHAVLALVELLLRRESELDGEAPFVLKNLSQDGDDRLALKDAALHLLGEQPQLGHQLQLVTVEDLSTREGDAVHVPNAPDDAVEETRGPELQLDRGRGPVATVLVQDGTLRNSDNFVVGNVYGKVRAMFDDRGAPLQEAPPSTPVEILGMEGLPQAGRLFRHRTPRGLLYHLCANKPCGVAAISGERVRFEALQIG